MSVLGDALIAAIAMLAAFDADLVEIVLRSMQVSLSAVALAAIIGLPLGAVLALTRFPGRRLILVTFNALMGLPPVVVGLVVYLMLSRSGPFGVLNLLFTPGAMIIAQFILVLPIITSLCRESLEAYWAEYRDTLRSMGASPAETIRVILWDGRYTLATAHLAGFGRAIAEVGAVMIVGGNIDHLTRVMTTAIALESSKGDLVLALALGIVLVMLSLAVNFLVYALKTLSEGRAL